MRLNADQSVGSEPLELEVTKIAANWMEHRRLLVDQVIDSSQDKVFCLAGFTYSQQIAEKAIAAKGKKMFEEMVPEQYWDFAKVFSEEESQCLPWHQPWDHAIDLEPDAVQKWKIKSYPMSPNEQSELDKLLTKHIQKGYLVPSKLPMASLVFFIKKKDGKLRLVQDYRRLNKITIKNQYPLPLAADIINRLTKAQYFTKFNVQWGYLLQTLQVIRFSLLHVTVSEYTWSYFGHSLSFLARDREYIVLYFDTITWLVTIG